MLSIVGTKHTPWITVTVPLYKEPGFLGLWFWYVLVFNTTGYEIYNGVAVGNTGPEPNAIADADR